MSGAMRRVLTAKMLAVSALALAGIVMSVVWRRRGELMVETTTICLQRAKRLAVLTSAPHA